jgi:hypothetical protein
MKKFGEIVMLEVFALLLLFVGTLWAGEIYKWVDENGVVSYSNVAPPEDEADVGVIEETRQDESAQASQDEVTSPSATQDVEPPTETAVPQTKASVDDDVAERVKAALKNRGKPESPAEPAPELTEEEMTKLEAAAKDEHIKAKPLREKYVTQRIEELERSIEEIQKQLKQRPHDESLERALTFKKENLRKYKQAVQTGNY